MLSDRDYYQHSRPEMLKFLPPDYSAVLEVGCGEGNFARQLRQGCEVWGVEFDRNSAELASRCLKKVLRGKYDQVAGDIPGEYFDVVICNDVIEHMVDHDWFFDSIRSKLRNPGFLVASIPNVRHVRNLYELLVAKDWRYREFGVLDRTHVRFFTEKSILRTLRNHGFSVEKIRGINNSEGIIGRLVVRLVAIITLGYYSDIQYLQFGIRARKDNLSSTM